MFSAVLSVIPSFSIELSLSGPQIINANSTEKLRLTMVNVILVGDLPSERNARDEYPLMPKEAVGAAKVWCDVIIATYYANYPP
jgi:hypothetical protein